MSVQVETLRSQLRLLQAVGFGSVEGEDGHQLEQGGPGESEAQTGQQHAIGMGPLVTVCSKATAINPALGWLLGEGIVQAFNCLARQS